MIEMMVIGMLLFLLIPPVALSQWGVLIAWHERVKYPYMYVKKCALSVITQKLSAATSSQALSSLFTVRWITCSSVIGCRGGSVPTLWQT